MDNTNDFKVGKKIDQIKVGDSFSVTEAIRERDVLLYMGVTGDANPAYSPYRPSGVTPDVRPIVPPIALIGVITKTVSVYFPGPGSSLVEININFSQPIHHNSAVTFFFEVTRVEELKEFVTIQVIGKDEEDNRVLDAMITVVPPAKVLELATNKIDSGVYRRISGGDEFSYDG